MHITYTYIFCKLLFSSSYSHFFKRSLKGKEVLSIESDRFPLIFTSPVRLRNAKKGLKKQKTASHQSLNKIVV